MNKPLIIYNLFPRLLGKVENWIKFIPHIRNMKFNWIYVNPFHYPGFSGSLYAPKDYYDFNPMFAPRGKEGVKLIKKFIKECDKKNIDVMMDLVINHSASDCILVEQHPDWYKREADGSLVHPYCVDPADTNKKTVWGDLAEFNNNPDAPCRKELWEYWLNLVKYYAKLGFKGFRADAAYKVPEELWAYIISETKKEFSNVIFFAETLGAEEKDLERVVKAGFDYVTNSSKWWDFKASWCIEQYFAFRKYAPSVSFPETHDTERLFKETNGNLNAQKMKYAFSAFFSAGVMMPIGYEWGFMKKLDVVKMTTNDFEEKHIDISDFIKEVNNLKIKEKIFHYDSDMKIYDFADEFFIMKKSIENNAVICVFNKDVQNNKELSLTMIEEKTGHKIIKKIFPKEIIKENIYSPGEARIYKIK